MFQHRATQFDPRVFAIAGHLRPSKKNSAELEERRPKRIRERVSREQPDRRGYLANPERHRRSFRPWPARSGRGGGQLGE
jgi:hypothetical protein